MRTILLASLVGLAMTPPALAQETLVVLETRETGDRAYTPLRVTADAVSPGAPIERPGRSRPGGAGIPVPRANVRALPDALDAGRLYLATERGGTGARIEEIVLFADGPSRGVDLDQIPTALFALGGRCWAGGDGWIGAADLSADPGSFQVLHRYQPPDKAIDFFVRDGRWLVAVDDILAPYYAHVFELDDSASAAFRRTVELPGVINGHYAEGTASGGRAYFVVPFSVLEAWGHGLAEFDVETLRSQSGEHAINSRGTREGWVEESASRVDPSEATLLAGTELTRVRGISILGERLVAGAGERGVLVVTLPLGEETRGSLVDVGGTCLDLVVRGDHAFALVAAGDETRTLAALEADGGDLRVAARFALPGRPERFVR